MLLNKVVNMSATVEKAGLTAAEEQVFNDTVIPIIKALLPAPEQANRLAVVVKDAITRAKAKYSQLFGGTVPMGGQLGFAIADRKDWNLGVSGWRVEYTATGFTTTAPVVSSFTTSKFSYLIPFGFMNLEPTPRSRAAQWVAGGVTQPPVNLDHVVNDEFQLLFFEPFIITPATVVSLQVDRRTTGFDELIPRTVKVSTQNEMIATSFVA